MTKEEIKPTVDEMIKNVLKYMSKALEDDTEFYELSVECATSFITSTINIDGDMFQIIDDIINKSSDVSDATIGRILEYKEDRRDKIDL